MNSVHVYVSGSLKYCLKSYAAGTSDVKNAECTRVELHVSPRRLRRPERNRFRR